MAALGEIAIDPAAALTDDMRERLIGEAWSARTRIREAAYQQLHRDAYRGDVADAILSRVPADLDALVERVVTHAAGRLGFSVERMRGTRKFSIEFGGEALVDSLPGVAAGSSWVGTFDREEAVEDETIDFFASGHALVEGLLAHYEESAEGRVGCVEVTREDERVEGIAAIYKDGLDVEVRAFDSRGRPRDEWAAELRGHGPAIHPRRETRLSMGGEQLVERLRPLFDAHCRPHAIAALVVGDEDRRGGEDGHRDV